MKKTIILTAIFFCLTSLRSEAASFYFSPDQASDEASRINLFLNSNSSSVNAVSGILVFDPAEIEVLSVHDGGTAVAMWLEPPKQEGGEIRFSGIIPGGLMSEKIQILSLDLRMKASPAEFVFRESKVYLNDGLGTEAELEAPLLTLREGTHIPPVEDRTPPESFTPEISRDPAIFDNKYFISWSTTDKESGIDRYEVLEAPVWGRSKLGNWHIAVSPYVLENQGRTGSIYVRAVDKAGNFRIVEVKPEGRSNTQYIYVIIAVGLICLMIGWRRKKRRT